MSLSDELYFIQQRLNEVKAFLEVRSQLNGIYTNCARLQQMVIDFQTNQLFDSIPAETKTAYNRLYQLTLQLKSDMESDPDFEELINF